MKTRKLVIVEKNLNDHQGHHWTQAEQLKSIFPNHSPYLIAGERYNQALGKAEATISADDTLIRRELSRLHYGSTADRVRATIRLIKNATLSDLKRPSLVKCLTEIAENLSLNERDIIVVPTADIDELEAAVQFSRSSSCRTPIHLRFIHPSLGETKERILKKRIAAIRPLLSDQVWLYSETAEMAKFLDHSYGLNVKGGFFMPCSVNPDQSFTLATDNTKFRVGVLGSARRDKGSHRIGPIIDALFKLEQSMESLALDRPIIFVLQPETLGIQASPYYSNIAHLDRLEIHPAGAGPDAFLAIMASCDLLLLPYELSEYQIRGSGLIQDAVAAGIPIVHTKGIAMQSFLNHGNALGAKTDDEYAKAILSVAQDSSEFKKGALAARLHYSSLLRSSPILALRDC